MRTLIKDAEIVLRDNTIKANLIIKDKFIESISEDIPEVKIDKTINANGLILLPGVIDDQVHFREPGLTHKAEILTESKAAAAGGVTSFMEMPNTNPQTINDAELKKKFDIAAKNSAVNYSFYLGATNDNIKEIKKLDPKTVCGVKVFMGSSTGNMLVNNIKTLERIFAESPVLIATHCEDEDTIQYNTKVYKEKFGENLPFKYHPVIRSTEACYKSSSLAVELAEKYGSKLHVLHITSAKELELFNTDSIENKKITSEVCVHHLYFNDTDYDTYGARIKWNPAVKTKEDQKALFKGLLANKLDVIATDHAPHTLEEKSNTYFKAPSGGPLIQHSLVAMMEFVKEGKMSLQQLAHKMCEAPSIIYNIDRRGTIDIGNYADLVLINPNELWEVDTPNILYKCKWSPFEKRKFHSKVKYTFVNGTIVYVDGNPTIDPGNGMSLEFNR